MISSPSGRSLTFLAVYLALVSCSDSLGPSVDLSLELTAERPIGEDLVPLPDVDSLHPGDWLRIEMVVTNHTGSNLRVGDFKILLRSVTRPEPNLSFGPLTTGPLELRPGQAVRIGPKIDIPEEFGQQPGPYSVSVVLPDLGMRARSTFTVSTLEP